MTHVVALEAVMTHVVALEAGQFSQGTFEPITPVYYDIAILAVFHNNAFISHNKAIQPRRI